MSAKSQDPPRHTAQPPSLWAVAGNLVRGRVAQDVGSTTVGNVIGAVASLGAGAILAHWLGPSLRGAFELGLFSANSGVLILSLGLNLPIAVFLKREREKGLWAYHFGLKVLASVMVIGAIAALVLRTSSGGGAGRIMESVAPASLAAFGGLFLLQLVNALLIGEGFILWLNATVVTRWCLYLLGIALLATLVRADSELALSWYAGAAVAGAALGWYGTRGGRAVQSASPRGRRLDALWYGIRGQLSNILQFASYRFDVLLVGAWVGSAALGVYAVGVLFAETVWLLPNAVGTVLLSHTSRSSVDEADRRIAVVFPATMGVVTVGALLASAVAPLSVLLYFGEAYAEVPTVTWLLLPGTVALSGAKVLANELTARGYPGINTLVALFGAGATVVADLALIPRQGIQGAAVASSLGYSITFTLTLLAFRRRAGTWPWRKRVRS